MAEAAKKAYEADLARIEQEERLQRSREQSAAAEQAAHYERLRKEEEARNAHYAEQSRINDRRIATAQHALDLANQAVADKSAALEAAKIDQAKKLQELNAIKGSAPPSSPVTAAPPSSPVALPPGIKITSVRYGTGDVTKHLVHANGQSSFSYQVDARVLGDPQPGVAKAFAVSWDYNGVRQPDIQIPAEAHGKSINIGSAAAAPPPSGIKINSVRYGTGDVTKHLVHANGLSSFSYQVDARVLGDPQPGVAKAFAVSWDYNGVPQPNIQIPAEAHGKSINLGGH